MEIPSNKMPLQNKMCHSLLTLQGEREIKISHSQEFPRLNHSTKEA
jgi:hypothetical protein